MFKGKNMEKNKKTEISTLIGKGSSINGNLKIKGGIKIDGEIVGTVETDGFLTLGSSGLAKANVKAKECLIAGKVEGDIYVENTLELDKTAKVNGDIFSKILKIHSGAELNGNCSMKKEPQQPDDNKFFKNNKAADKS
ncbi:MAG: hypothetical protein CSB55_01920 [Candidatus Cloacimonadota bacterium]|nr:MAG: hypothetical protein CSB55_01920 [Candidatus Cloacimonadota bacterium]